MAIVYYLNTTYTVISLTPYHQKVTDSGISETVIITVKVQRVGFTGIDYPVPVAVLDAVWQAVAVAVGQHGCADISRVHGPCSGKGGFGK